MLHIIGWIFKCILILLAILIGIILLLLATVLFVPIKYEGKAEFPGKVEETTAWLKVTWLLHLVRADVTWKDGELNWKMRVAWKSFQEIKEKKLKYDTPEPQEEETKHNTPEPQEKETKSDTTRPQKEKFKIKGFWQHIKYTIQKIYDKIKEGIDLKDELLIFLKEKVHRAAFLRMKKELIWLKRFFKVTKANIKLRFGFEDPSVTGNVLGAISILYALMEGNIDVTPDFEEKCLEGQIYLKGRMRMIYMVVPAIHLVADKAVRQTYKDFKEWKES